MVAPLPGIEQLFHFKLSFAAVAGSAFSAGNANANGEGHVRVARQAGTEPGFVYNGVWYPLNDYEFKYVLIPDLASID
jgi:hypothetical protein